jgi:hypothetical protein
MNNDERIIKYLDGELSTEEKTLFEEELKNSEELSNEYQKYLKVCTETDHLKNIKLTQQYTDNILIEFHEKFDKRRSLSFRKNLGYAFALMLVFVISVAVLKSLFFNNQTEIADFTESLTSEQKIEVLKNLNGESTINDIILDNVSESDLVSLIESDLQVNSEIAETYHIDYNEIVSGLTEKEVENIYQKIINTNLLEEASL